MSEIKQNHSPEPWVADPIRDVRFGMYPIKSADGRGIVLVEVDLPNDNAGEGWVPEAEGLANRERIIAAVNACRGLPTETLLEIASGHAILDVRLSDAGERHCAGSPAADDIEEIPFDD